MMLKVHSGSIGHWLRSCAGRRATCAERPAPRPSNPAKPVTVASAEAPSRRGDLVPNSNLAPESLTISAKSAASRRAPKARTATPARNAPRKGRDIFDRTQLADRDHVRAAAARALAAPAATRSTSSSARHSSTDPPSITAMRSARLPGLSDTHRALEIRMFVRSRLCCFRSPEVLASR